MLDHLNATTGSIIVGQQLFTWPDYLVFIFMLIVCIFIGVYFGFLHVSKDVDDYLVGGRSMHVWPVAISLVTSYVSGISLLGLPTEVYVYGMQMLYSNLDIVVLYFAGTSIFLPVFMELQLTSMYEYLEKRFDISLRRLGSVLFIVNTICWLPIVIYVPALALNQATNVNVHIMTPVISAICIFYTCFGGLRAVIWTDFLQGILMVGSVILVLLKGTYNIGGPGIVIQRNLDSTRIEYPDMELSLTKRLTMVGMMCVFFNYIKSGFIDQMMVQRYISLPTLKDAKRAVIVFLCLKTMFYGLILYVGFLIYATYYNCDPISTKIIKAKDQLLPLLVIDTLGGIPGAAGLFLAGVFSASLSSLSSGLNSMAAVLLEDIYKPVLGDISQKHATIFVKTSVVVTGVLIVVLAFFVEKLGTVIQLSISLSSITSGPLVGIFCLGVLLPWINGKGALFGGITGLCFMALTCFGNQAAVASGAIKYPTKPVSVEGCSFGNETVFNSTFTTSTEPLDIFDNSEVFYLFRISFLYYTTMGTLMTVIVGVLVSYLTGFNDPQDVDKKYLSPFIRKYFTSKHTSTSNKCLGIQEIPKEKLVIDLQEMQTLLKATNETKKFEKEAT